jgi:multidrug efflux system membrane fusion protein
VERPGEHQITGKPKKRGWIWGIVLLAVAGIAGYTVFVASQPGYLATVNKGGGQGKGGGGGGRRGGGGGGGGGGGFGPIPVAAAKASLQPVPVFLNGLGTVQAYYTVVVRSRVDGQLMNIFYREGDFVQEGQKLAEIDPRPFQVQLAQAEGVYTRDTANLANAKLDLERYRTLLAQDAIPKQQLDTQTALVSQLEGTVKTDQANIDNAKLQLIYSNITAPITGRIGLRLVDPGNIVRAADQNGILTVTQLQPISVVFTVPEDNLPQVMSKIRGGAKLRAEAWNRDNSQRLAVGELITVDNVIDTNTGTSKMKAVFDNKDNVLYPNQFVNVRLLVDTLTGQTVIPTVAVQTGQQGPFVYVVDDQSIAHMRNISMGVTDQNISAVTKGLQAGEQVAVDGADRLTDGAQVRVRQAGEVEAEAAADAAALRNRGRGRGGRGARGGPGGGGDGKGGNFKGGDFKGGGGPRGGQQ